jgi:hypothetical protein
VLLSDSSSTWCLLASYDSQSLRFHLGILKAHGQAARCRYARHGAAKLSISVNPQCGTEALPSQAQRLTQVERRRAVFDLDPSSSVADRRALEPIDHDSGARNTVACSRCHARSHCADGVSSSKHIAGDSRGCRSRSQRSQRILIAVHGLLLQPVPPPESSRIPKESHSFVRVLLPNGRELAPQCAA